MSISISANSLSSNSSRNTTAVWKYRLGLLTPPLSQCDHYIIDWPIFSSNGNSASIDVCHLITYIRMVHTNEWATFNLDYFLLTQQNRSHQWKQTQLISGACFLLSVSFHNMKRNTLHTPRLCVYSKGKKINFYAKIEL